MAGKAPEHFKGLFEPARVGRDRRTEPDPADRPVAPAAWGGGLLEAGCDRPFRAVPCLGGLPSPGERQDERWDGY